MIYDTLDYLPIKLFYKIQETGNINLLSTDKDNDVYLQPIWDKLLSDHEEISSNDDDKRSLTIHKKIAQIECINDIIISACVSLEFEKNNDLIDLLKELGYVVKTDSNDNYHKSIDDIRKKVRANEIKLSHHKSQLPKKGINNEKRVTLDQVMASYCAILGIDFDYNTISVTKFYALQEQVNKKIKSFEDATNKIK